MWGRAPPKHWAHLQVIDWTLREDARHAAAAVMGMWDAYSKASPTPLPSPSAIRKRSPSLALLYAVRKARPQSPSLSTRDFPATEPRSLY